MRLRSISTATAIALFLPASSVFALTPEEVWENWKSRVTGASTVVTVESEQRVGDTLEIKGITLGLPIDEKVTASAAFAQMNLKALPDNSVLITFGETQTITITDTANSANSDALTIVQQGTEIIATGTIDAVSYEGKATKITASGTLGSAMGNDGPLAIELTLHNAKGSDITTRDAEGNMSTTGTSSGGPLQLSMSNSTPEAGKSVVVNAEIASYSGSNAIVTPAAANQMKLDEALRNGMSLLSDGSFGKVTFTVDFADGEETAATSGTIDSVAAKIGISQKAMEYSLSTGATTVSVEGNQLPLPKIDVSLAELGYRILMPMSKTEAAEDFAYETRIVDLALSEGLWSMIDPTSQLGRDPITVIADVKGKGALQIDLLDPGLQDGSAEVPDMPIRLDSLDLTQLLIKAVGAELGASGALVFDNNDLTSWEGIPAPTGKITANAKGVNALLDKLVALGFVGPDELTGARMMIAMFAKPGANPDELVSELDFQGPSLSINGQRIR